jgi:hypothetical protein
MLPFLKCHPGALPDVLNYFQIKLFLAGRGGGVAHGEMQGEPEPCSRALSMSLTNLPCVHNANM